MTRCANRPLAMLVGIAPRAKAPATAQSIWPSAQCVASVGTASAAMTNRLVPAASRIRSPKTNRYIGTSKKPPPLASSPVNNPTPADAAANRRRFLRRMVPADRVDCSIGRSTRCPTTIRTSPETTSRIGPPISSDSRRPRSLRQATRRRASTPLLAAWPPLLGRRVPPRPRAAGMVAGSGEATARSPGTPRTASNGVAMEEPPTPNRPVKVPIAAPATTKTGQGAIRPTS